MLEECVGDEWERSWELEDLTNIHSEYKNQELEIYKPSQESCMAKNGIWAEKKIRNAINISDLIKKSFASLA